MSTGADAAKAATNSLHVPREARLAAGAEIPVGGGEIRIY
jgi:hypothetical protein